MRLLRCFLAAFISLGLFTTSFAKDKDHDHDKDKDRHVSGKDHPPGWDHGKKTGWDGKSVPPGQAKKQTEYREAEHHDRDRDRHVASNHVVAHHDDAERRAAEKRAAERRESEKREAVRRAEWRRTHPTSATRPQPAAQTTSNLANSRDSRFRR